MRQILAFRTLLVCILNHYVQNLVIKEDRGNLKGLLKYYGIEKVFILGAGFSAPAGLPLTYELLRHIHAISSAKPWYGEGGMPYSWGQAEWLLEELQFYYPTLDFSHKSIASGTIPAGFDIEQFMSYVAAESAFVEKTGEKWNDHGSKFLAWLKGWLAEAIYIKQEQMFGEAPNVYYQFSSTLEGALILSFNWDTLLEELLARQHFEYTYDFSDRITDAKRIPIIKLHGSIDWFSMPSELSRKDWMSFDPLGKSLDGYYKARGDLRRYFNGFLSPWIVVPSYDKISQILKLGDTWTTPWIFLQDELEIIIIGFSMRQDDYHSRAFIYPQLVQGTRDGSLKVKVVDIAANGKEEGEITERFQGVENISYFFEGFGEQAIDFINGT